MARSHAMHEEGKHDSQVADSFGRSSSGPLGMPPVNSDSERRKRQQTKVLDTGWTGSLARRSVGVLDPSESSAASTILQEWSELEEDDPHITTPAVAEGAREEKLGERLGLEHSRPSMGRDHARQVANVSAGTEPRRLKHAINKFVRVELDQAQVEGSVVRHRAKMWRHGMAANPAAARMPVYTYSQPGVHSSWTSPDFHSYGGLGKKVGRREAEVQSSADISGPSTTRRG